MRLINEAKYDIRTLQLRLLPVLVCIDKVCREHHLRYYLCAGTMLGAVRHRGFIPWDDDVDVCMPRPLILLRQRQVRIRLQSKTFMSRFCFRTDSFRRRPEEECLR